MKLVYTMGIFFITLTHSLAQNVDWGFPLNVEDDTSASLPFNHLNQMCRDVHGNIYTTGEFQGYLNFNPKGSPYYVTNTINEYDQGYVAKYDSLGNLKYVNLITGGNVFAIVTDNKGFIYVAGKFFGTIIFENGSNPYTISGPGGNGYQGFFAKYDTLGNFIYAKQVGNTVYDLFVDHASSIYLAGQYKGIQDFDPGSAVVNLPVYGGSDLFYSKFNSSGNLIWAKGIGGASDDDSKCQVIADSYGDVFFIGSFLYTIDFNPDGGVQNQTAGTTFPMASIFLTKYNPDGSLNKCKKIDSCDVGDVKITSTNDIFITGGYYGHTGFDPETPFDDLKDGGIYFAKYSSDLILDFVRGIGSINYQTSIDIDAKGYIYLAGNLSGGLTDPITGNGLNVNGQLFFGKFTPQGASVSINVLYDQNIPNTIIVDNIGNIIISGLFSNSGDFDPTDAVFTLNNTTSSSISAFIVKYSMGPGIIVNSNLNPIPSGYFYDFGNVSVGSNSKGSFQIVNAGSKVLNLTGDPEVLIQGTNETDFFLEVISLPSTLNPNDTARFVINFNPSDLGVRSAQLVISNSANDPYTIDLTGVGKEQTTTGVSNSKNNFIKVYPNPSLDGNIVIDIEEEILEVNIIDVLGQKEVFYDKMIHSNRKGNMIVLVKTSTALYSQKVLIK
jgi:hypothetical protein